MNRQCLLTSCFFINRFEGKMLDKKDQTDCGPSVVAKPNHSYFTRYNQLYHSRTKVLSQADFPEIRFSYMFDRIFIWRNFRCLPENHPRYNFGPFPKSASNTFSAILSSESDFGDDPKSTSDTCGSYFHLGRCSAFTQKPPRIHFWQYFDQKRIWAFT